MLGSVIIGSVIKAVSREVDAKKDERGGIMDACMGKPTETSTNFPESSAEVVQSSWEL